MRVWSLQDLFITKLIFNSNMLKDHINDAVNFISLIHSHLSFADEFRNMKSRPIANQNRQVKNKGNNIL